jgi:hypothetical protein
VRPPPQSTASAGTSANIRRFIRQGFCRMAVLAPAAAETRACVVADMLFARRLVAASLDNLDHLAGRWLDNDALVIDDRVSKVVVLRNFVDNDALRQRFADRDFLVQHD